MTASRNHPCRLIPGLFLFLVLGAGCRFLDQSPRNFYNTIAGWDIRHIPVIDPVRVTSTDGGHSWYLTRNDFGNNSEVTAFGVSENLLYGRGERRWFVYDTKSRLFAEYDTEAGMQNCLEHFRLKQNPILDCDVLFDSLANGGRPYWFPPEGGTYPRFPALKPDRIYEVRIRERKGEDPELVLPNQVRENKAGIYFFRVRYSGPPTDSFQLSFEDRDAVPLRDSLVMPVFEGAGSIDVTLFMPYDLARKKGIPESRRLHQSGQIPVFADPAAN